MMPKWLGTELYMILPIEVDEATAEPQSHVSIELTAVIVGWDTRWRNIRFQYPLQPPEKQTDAERIILPAWVPTDPSD